MIFARVALQFAFPADNFVWIIFQYLFFFKNISSASCLNTFAYYSLRTIFITLRSQRVLRKLFNIRKLKCFALFQLWKLFRNAEEIKINLWLVIKMLKSIFAQVLKFKNNNIFQEVVKSKFLICNVKKLNFVNFVSNFIFPMFVLLFKALQGNRTNLELFPVFYMKDDKKIT